MTAFILSVLTLVFSIYTFNVKNKYIAQLEEMIERNRKKHLEASLNAFRELRSYQDFERPAREMYTKRYLNEKIAECASMLRK